MIRRIAAVAVLAMLIFVPSSLRAQNSAVTPNLINKIVKAAAERGVDRPLIANIANALDLTVGNQSWPSRHFGVDDGFGATHAIELDRGNAQDMVMIVRTPDGIIQVFRTRRDGTIVKAITYSTVTKIIQVRALEGTQKELDAEFLFWARSVDKLLSGALPDVTRP